jgi:hypothetical protein
MKPIRNPLFNLSDYEAYRRRLFGEHDPHSQQAARPPSSREAGALREALPPRSDRIEELHRRTGLSPSFNRPSRAEVLNRPSSRIGSSSSATSNFGFPLPSLASIERSSMANVRRAANQDNFAGPVAFPSRPIQNFGQAGPSFPDAAGSVAFTRGLEYKGTGLRKRGCTIAAIAMATKNRFGTVCDVAVRIANYDGSDGVQFDDGKRILEELGVSASVHRQNGTWSQFPDRSIITVVGPTGGPHAVYFRRKPDGSEVIYDWKKIDSPVPTSGYQLLTGGHKYIALAN